MTEPASPLARRMTVAEFLTFDDGTDTRHELVDGQPMAMAAPAGRHVVIAANVFRVLDRRLAPPCRPYFDGGVARRMDDDQFRMPDLFVSCVPPGEAYFDQPRLLIEILSPSTAKEDRSRKLDFYKSFASAELILFVWQDARRVELHSREPDSWRVRDYVGSGEVPLPGLASTLTLDEIYADITFSA